MPKPMLISLIVVWASMAQVYARPTPMSGHQTPADASGWREINERAQTARVLMLDENYQKGKAIFLGKGKHKRYPYCVTDVNSATPEKRITLKRSNLLPFREMPVVEFVKQLFDCENPKQWVLNYLEKEDAGYVVYYLNRHYKLNLKQ